MWSVRYLIENNIAKYKPKLEKVFLFSLSFHMKQKMNINWKELDYIMNLFTFKELDKIKDYETRIQYVYKIVAK